MTPKSLLRHKECVSKVSDFTEGHFHNMIDDLSVDKNRIKKIILCSGKIYYDLESHRKLVAMNILPLFEWNNSIH